MRTNLIIIMSFFLASCGCSSVKINKNEEKIGILNEDYTISFFKQGKKHLPTLKINTFDENNIQINDFFVQIGDSLYKNTENRKGVFNIEKLKANNLVIRNFGYKSIHIKIKVNHQDSIVLNTYFKDYPIFEHSIK